MLKNFDKSNERTTSLRWLILIVLIGFSLRLYMAWSNPFLNPWDERFHALVAKNMMENPFKPMLWKHPINELYDPNAWCCNHIWLHKQPLFLWQMAISMKLFGVSELALRLPSVIMGTLLILIVYRIAYLFFSNRKLALLAAALLACSNFHLLLVSGIKGMDHNDVALGFYVLASIWAYIEYLNSSKLSWIFLVGLFAGCAVLNKWLLGILVYGGWGLVTLLQVRKSNFWKEAAKLLCSLIVCCLVFFPWQIYILETFPEQARFEYDFNSRHLTEALEGHDGAWYFYLEHLPKLLSWMGCLLLGFGFYYSTKLKELNKQLNIMFLVQLAVVFVFFSFVVQTKNDAYLYFVMPLCFLYVALAFRVWYCRIRLMYVRIVFMMALFAFAIDPIQLYNFYTVNNTERQDRIHNATIYKNIKYQLPDNVRVVMNCNAFEDIDVMFYNDGITAYAWVKSEAEFKEFEQRKILIAVFDREYEYQLPDYVRNYPYLFLIPNTLKPFY